MERRSSLSDWVSYTPNQTTISDHNKGYCYNLMMHFHYQYELIVCLQISSLHQNPAELELDSYHVKNFRYIQNPSLHMCFFCCLCVLTDCFVCLILYVPSTIFQL